MQLDTLVQRLWQIREEKRELAAVEKKLNAEFDELKTQILQAFSDQGVKSIKTTVARVTASESTVVKVNDWDGFYAYVKENDAFHLLQKRPASSACKELTNILGENIPGTELITLTDLSITTAR